MLSQVSSPYFGCFIQVLTPSTSAKGSVLVMEKLLTNMLSGSFPAISAGLLLHFRRLSLTNLSESGRVVWGMSAGRYCMTALWTQSASPASLPARHTLADRLGLSTAIKCWCAKSYSGRGKALCWYSLSQRRSPLSWIYPASILH